MLEIHPAEIIDAKAILTLQHLSYQSEAKIYNDWLLPALSQTLESLAGEFQHSLILKAIIKGEIIGSVRALLVEGVCKIGRLIVHPEFQGQGIGSSLLAKIESMHCQAERFELFTGSKSLSNIEFYQRRGYVIDRTQILSEHLSLMFLLKDNNAGAVK